jgi:hypothetical protein
MERVWPEDLRSKGLAFSLQGPMSQHPSSLRVNYMSLAPSCSSIIHRRYLWVREPSVPPGSVLWLPLSICLSLLHLIQACKNNICLDLSPGHGLDGRLTGHRVETWDVKVRASMCIVYTGSVGSSAGPWQGLGDQFERVQA